VLEPTKPTRLRRLGNEWWRIFLRRPNQLELEGSELLVSSDEELEDASAARTGIAVRAAISVVFGGDGGSGAVGLCSWMCSTSSLNRLSRQCGKYRSITSWTASLFTSGRLLVEEHVTHKLCCVLLPLGHGRRRVR